MMIRHQRGHLRCTTRKNGPAEWEFLWRENDPARERLRRTAVIGTVEQIPTHDSALAQVIAVISQVQQAYWELVFARRNEQNHLSNVNLAREQLRMIEEQVSVGIFLKFAESCFLLCNPWNLGLYTSASSTWCASIGSVK